jgi:glutathione S-transferase
VYVLYHFPGNASLLPHILLREIGVPFELRLVDRSQGAQRSPEYLAMNPHGRIPVLVDEEGTVLYETAAIALHLCDRHPEAGLAPPPRTAGRALFYRWMVHLTNTPQPKFREWFYPHEHTADPAGTDAVKAKAEEALGGMFDRIAADLGDGPWLLGDRYSAADPFLFMLARWGRFLGRRPATIPAIGALCERVTARPAVRAALEAEGLKPPIV